MIITDKYAENKQTLFSPCPAYSLGAFRGNLDDFESDNFALSRIIPIIRAFNGVSDPNSGSQAQRHTTRPNFRPEIWAGCVSYL
jgi:hypothetical protein